MKKNKGFFDPFSMSIYMFTLGTAMLFGYAIKDGSINKEYKKIEQEESKNKKTIFKLVWENQDD